MSLSSRIARLARLALLAAIVAAGAAPPAAAQGRRVLPAGHPEAQLMGYYAAVLAFTPIGTVMPGVEVGGELSIIPSLSDDQRRVGFGGTKYEDTNRCPVVPRLRGSGTTGPLNLELGYVPPLRVCGVQANLLGAAVSTRLLTLRPGWRLFARGSLLAGTLSAAITCSDDAVQDANNLICFQGNPSDDAVKPLAFGADVMLVHGWGGHHDFLDLYALVGVRRERVQFDVNFTSTAVIAPSVFDDRERYETSLTRAHVAAGLSFRFLPRVRLSAELFHAPGAVTTVRGRAGWLLRGAS